MSFEAVWGFDPDQVLKAQNLFQKHSVLEYGEHQDDGDDIEKVSFPPSVDAQLYELKRMFRL